MPNTSQAPADRAVPAVFTAPPQSGEVVLGRTLVSLLDEAALRHPNSCAFNEKAAGGWRSLSNRDFLKRAERLALGLLDLGLEPGETVAFYTESDLSFCLPDMACLLAGLVTAPIYLTHPESAVLHILNETESRLLVCGTPALLGQLAPVLGQTRLETVLLYTGDAEGVKLPESVRLKSVAEVEASGAATHSPERVEELRERISPHDLATILYTSGTTGTPKGVMLSHENISSNAISAMTGLTGFRSGADGEVALSFLPLTHIFARTLHYCLMWCGVSVYFSDPEALRDDLKSVKPTFFASVPRVLERAYERILTTGESLTGAKRKLFDWALDIAKRYRVETPPVGLDAVQHRLADKLVFSKWRAALGGNIRQIIVGGAALRAELVNVLGAAGVQVLQGYGLTETSPVIAFNRPERNRPGTVGPVLAGVEVKLGAGGEIMTRGPHVMKGYYRQPEKTAEVLDAEGWFHTGDLGEVSEDGYLKITGRAKNLFKLSTGKYVMPQPLEERLEAQPLIGTALVVGENEKYCAALLFVNEEMARSLTGAATGQALLESKPLQDRLREVMREANGDLPHWSAVKRAALIMGEISMANGLLTPTLKVRRPRVQEAYKDVVEALYRERRPLENTVILDL